MATMSFTVTVETTDVNPENGQTNASVLVKPCETYPKSEEEFKALKQDEEVAAAQMVNDLIGAVLREIHDPSHYPDSKPEHLPLQ